MMIKKSVLVIIVCLISNAFAWGEKLVLVTGEWAPYTSASLEKKGMCSEIVMAVLKEMKKEGEIEFLPWKRCEYNVNKEKAWAAFPYAITEERKKKYVFSDPIGQATIRFFFYKNNLKMIDWNKLEDLKPYKVGGVLGYSYEAAFKKAGLKTDLVRNSLMNFKKLKVGRIDLFPDDELAASTIIKKEFPEDISNFGKLKKPLESKGIHLIIPKNNEESIAIMNEFNTALKTIKTNGVYDNIISSYFIQ